MTSKKYRHPQYRRGAALEQRQRCIKRSEIVSGLFGIFSAGCWLFQESECEFNNSAIEMHSIETSKRVTYCREDNDSTQRNALRSYSVRGKMSQIAKLLNSGGGGSLTSWL